MAQNQALPTPAYPLVDNSGKVSPVWFQFFNSIWQRTGGGFNNGNVQSIQVNSGSGITSSVSEANGVATIDLTLGAIEPLSVNSQGPVSGTTGLFTEGLSTLGTMQFGTQTLAATTAIGYVTIIDIHGNPVKLMISS